MDKKKLLIRGLILVLVVGILCWRLWPRSMDSFMDWPSREANRVSAYLDMGVMENGEYIHRKYSLKAKNQEEAQALLEILRKGRYQVSFTNLLPWTWGSLSSGYGFDGRMVDVYAFCDGEEPKAASMIFYGSDKASVEGRRINFLGNEMFDELAEYIQTHGYMREEY